jgi:hypothetical protein
MSKLTKEQYSKVRSEIAKAQKNRYIFTREQRSRGGANAREKETSQGTKLNHGVVFGRRIR